MKNTNNTTTNINSIVWVLERITNGTEPTDALSCVGFFPTEDDAMRAMEHMDKGIASAMYTFDVHALDVTPFPTQGDEQCESCGCAHSGTYMLCGSCQANEAMMEAEDRADAAMDREQSDSHGSALTQYMDECDAKEDADKRQFITDIKVDDVVHGRYNVWAKIEDSQWYYLDWTREVKGNPEELIGLMWEEAKSIVTMWDKLARDEAPTISEYLAGER